MFERLLSPVSQPFIIRMDSIINLLLWTSFNENITVTGDEGLANCFTYEFNFLAIASLFGVQYLCFYRYEYAIYAKVIIAKICHQSTFLETLFVFQCLRVLTLNCNISCK